MEGSIDYSEHGTHWVRWSFVGSLNWHMGSCQLFLVDGSEPIWENEEEIMRQQQQHRSDMKTREEELQIQLERCQRSDLFTQIQRLEVDLSLWASELWKVREQERTWRRVSNEKTAEMEVLEKEI
ncbi:hypothetical protein Gogos_015130 [Gossypium gossypioides]|uniref:Uncharacterized protein n=1 Tax=Gossypium gossypioides TaxID=34282 RepID=A0A7J9C0M5_GOSGO|nr:hypothetical protein [Gossypium gossypioides]